MIYTPNQTALRYLGDEPQRFKHLTGVRVFPMMSKGDIILVPSLTAHQLRKKSEYEVVDLNDIIGGMEIIDENVDATAEEEAKAAEEAAKAEAESKAAEEAAKAEEEANAKKPKGK